MSKKPASVVLRRRIAAPFAEVYVLLSDARELMGWLGPKDFVVTEVIADVRVGGEFRFSMHKTVGQNYAANGVYREIVPNQRIVLTWTWSEAPAGEPLDTAETLLTFEVEPDKEDPAGATWLTLTHAQLPDDASANSHGEGWSEALDKLEKLARKKRGDEK